MKCFFLILNITRSSAKSLGIQKTLVFKISIYSLIKDEHLFIKLNWLSNLSFLAGHLQKIILCERKISCWWFLYLSCALWQGFALQNSIASGGAFRSVQQIIYHLGCPNTYSAWNIRGRCSTKRNIYIFKRIMYVRWFQNYTRYVVSGFAVHKNIEQPFSDPETKFRSASFKSVKYNN